MEDLERERGLAAAGRADDDHARTVLARDRRVRRVVNGRVAVARTADEDALPALRDAVATSNRSVAHLRGGRQQGDAELVEFLQASERGDPTYRGTVTVARKNVVQKAILQSLGARRGWRRGTSRTTARSAGDGSPAPRRWEARDRDEELGLHARERSAVLLVDEMVGSFDLLDQQRVHPRVGALHIARLVLEVGANLLTTIAKLFRRQEKNRATRRRPGTRGA